MTIDLSMIVQGTMVLVLVGAGRSIWTASIAIAKLDERLNAHMDDDARHRGPRHSTS